MSSPRYSSQVEHERYYSLFAVTAVKIILFVFIVAFLGLTFKLLRTSLAHIGNAYRFVVPAMIVIIAVLLASDIRKNIKQLLALRKNFRAGSR